MWFHSTTPGMVWNERVLTKCVDQYLFIKATINPLRDIDACMRQQAMPSLVQIMAWRLFGAKPSSEPMVAYCKLTPKNKFIQISIKTRIFSLKNASEVIVCKMAAIFVKLEELHFATARKPLIHQNQPVAHICTKFSHACCSLCR